jgi:hypothetical protein
LGTTATGPELALAITFEIVDPDRLSSIAMIFAFGDAAIIDDVS